jgi:hypothetical protein
MASTRSRPKWPPAGSDARAAEVALALRNAVPGTSAYNTPTLYVRGNITLRPIQEPVRTILPRAPGILSGAFMLSYVTSS